MKKIRKVFVVALLIFWPFFASAQVAQIVFTTEEQSIETNEISGVLTIQLQDSEGNSHQTDETIDVEFSSSSETGEFLSPASTTPVTTTMASSTANKNFRYRDSAGGAFTITVEARGRDSGNEWSVSQTITVEAPVPTLPVTVISGTITSDSTWFPEEGTYILENQVTISASTTLTILPGTIIKGKHGGAGALIVEGTLVAVGTDQSKIYFTSYLDDEIGGDSDINGATTGAPGDWQGIYFTAGSAGNLEHVVVRYAGYGPGFPLYGHFVGIENDGGVLDIRHSNIHDNYRIVSNGGGGFMTAGTGIINQNGTLSVSDSIIYNNVFGVRVNSGTTTISNTVFQNNTDSTGHNIGYGVHANGEEPLTLLNNTFYNNDRTAFVEAQIDFSHTGNTSSDITNMGFERNGMITGDVVWNTNNDLPFIVPYGSNLWISAGGALTISPGSVVKFGLNTQIVVEGNLVAEGTETSNIYLTSLKDDSIAGDTNGDGVVSTPNAADWRGLQFWNGSTGNISHAIIKYAGRFNGTGHGAIFNVGGGILLNNVTFSDNFRQDVYQSTGSSTISHSLFSTSTDYALFNTGTSTMDARYNWWGADTGPTHASNATGTGFAISGDTLFDPWLKRDPALPNPVIIVPGIMGSYLNKEDGTEVWMNLLKMALPGDDSYLYNLQLSQDGTSLANLEFPDVIRKVNIPFFTRDIFDNLINTLHDHSYIEENDLFIFPYDWRLDIDISASGLNEKINQIKSQTGAEKVDLIAHSMGGFLIKKYLNDYSGKSLNKFVDIGTPHVGASKSFITLMYGDVDITILNKETLKIISQNMPSVYQLLPSSNYFDDSDPLYKYYLHDGSVNENLTFSQTKDYLKSAGRNALLVDRADEFHQEIDNLNPTDYGVETYNFVGCGVPTLGQIYIWGDDEYSIRMIDGDGTVPLKSAEAISAAQTFYVKDIKHAVMPSADGVRDLIAEILSGETSSVSTYSHIATDAAGCGVPNGDIVSFHSPIELHIYDESDNHAGPNEDGDIENNIDGVVYEVIESNKFAFLPAGTDYTIKGTATDEGTMDVHIQEIVGGEVVTTTIFADVPLTLNTQVNFDLDSNVPSQIYLDHDGDGVFESNQTISLAVEGFYQPVMEETGAESEEEEPQPVSTSSGSSRAGSSSINTNTEAENTPEPIVVASDESISQSISASQPSIQTEPRQTEIGEATTTEEIEDEPEEEPDEQILNNNNLLATVYQAVSSFLSKIFTTIWSWIVSRV